MELLKYVQELRDVANKFADDDEKKAAATQAADLAETLFNAVNGAKLSSVYLSLPVITAALASAIKAHNTGRITPDEREWFGAIHDTLEDVIDDLHIMLFADELKAHLAGSLTDEQIDAVLARVDDEKGN